ncbi:MAG: hypothetical protein H0T42_32605 [Deltaproteobacteria bacterium]|nr:hypothetical protein [Deltaproteobacteria bacterium]
MIVRTWRARATPVNARLYVAFFHRHLRPMFGAFQGHRGALVLTRADDVVVEITVLTMWDSFDAIAAFAPDVDRAVVEDEAKNYLLSFDPVVQHHHCALDTRLGRAQTSPGI